MDSAQMNHVTQIYQDQNGSSFHALNDLSLTWPYRKSIAVMGESGSGKSTLARLLIGLEKPTQGNVLIDQTDTSKWSLQEWRRHRADIQAVFQDTSGTLNPARSTYQNAEEALCNFTKLSATERKDRILALMELTELSPALLQVPVRKLSGGEQRRMALLRSLSIRPKFLIMDEVTAGLDLISADAVLRVLENYHREYACSYLVITHDMQTAKRLTEEIIEIKNGEIIRRAVQI